MKDNQLFHTVFFQLKDSSDAAVEAFINDCKKYLTGHPGLQSFHVGSLTTEHVRDVNVRDFHVSIHLIFKDKKSHDNYQTADRHKTFIDRNGKNFASVRVFDSYLR